MNVGDDLTLMELFIDSPADGTLQLQMNAFDGCRAAQISVCTVIYLTTNSRQLPKTHKAMDKGDYSFSQLK